MTPLERARQLAQDSCDGDPAAAGRAQAFALIAIAEQLEVLVDAAMLLPTLASGTVDLLQRVGSPARMADHPALRWDGPGCLMCDVDVDAHPDTASDRYSALAGAQQ